MLKVQTWESTSTLPPLLNQSCGDTGVGSPLGSVGIGMARKPSWMKGNPSVTSRMNKGHHVVKEGGPWKARFAVNGKMTSVTDGSCWPLQQRGLSPGAWPSGLSAEYPCVTGVAQDAMNITGVQWRLLERQEVTFWLRVHSFPWRMDSVYFSSCLK